MPILFLVEIELGNNRKSFLMVGEDLDVIETRVREKYKNSNIEWIDITEIVEVDKYKIKLTNINQ